MRASQKAKFGGRSRGGSRLWQGASPPSSTIDSYRPEAVFRGSVGTVNQKLPLVLRRSRTVLPGPKTVELACVRLLMYSSRSIRYFSWGEID